MKTRILTSFPIYFMTVLIVTVSLWSYAKADNSDTEPPEGKVIFQIGQEDKKLEFLTRGFTGIHEYMCTAGMNCIPTSFPARSYRMSAANIGDYSGVAQITIEFKLKRYYNEVVLRLARWGAETTVVTVDGKETHHVTSNMLGSNEDVHGVYNLALGALSKGRHTILLTVAEDGKGNGRHSWDALVLFAD